MVHLRKWCVMYFLGVSNQSLLDFCLNLLVGAPPPPPHAINRGIGTEGLGCILGDPISLKLSLMLSEDFKV